MGLVCHMPVGSNDACQSVQAASSLRASLGPPHCTDVRYWMKSIKEHSSPATQKILLGNKIDVPHKQVMVFCFSHPGMHFVWEAGR
jgi:hypothetical protein